MNNEFETALQGLLAFVQADEHSEQKYNNLFRQMITSSAQICNETDYASLVNKKIEEAEKKYGKMESTGETDPYKKLRELVRFEMSKEAVLAGKEYEVCCTESNYGLAVIRFRSELERIVPKGQLEVVDAMAYSLYSDFTKFFVCTALDMVADAKIYQMEEFRPLQLNAMGKELRTTANVLHQQKNKPQKSVVVTGWFRLMMILPAFLFKKLYTVNFTPMFDVPQKAIDDAARMYKPFDKIMETFASGDEYEILKEFLKFLNLESCFTVRPKVKAAENKSGRPMVN